MCLLLFAYRHHPQAPLVVAANRDEFHSRPTRAAGFWGDVPPRSGLLAGQDLTQGGTWLGVTRSGRFAAVTNFRTPQPRAGTLSRGYLTRDFLLGQMPPAEYLATLAKTLACYGGFNLLVGDRESLCYLNGLDGQIQDLQPGIYGLSNAELDSDWPKVQRGKASLQALLDAPGIPSTDRLTTLMLDRETAPDHLLPGTGLPQSLERTLSSSFIVNPQRGYGTRCTTALVIDRRDEVRFSEQSYDAGTRITSRHYFRFPLTSDQQQAA